MKTSYRGWHVGLILILLGLLAACVPLPAATPQPSQSPAASPAPALPTASSSTLPMPDLTSATITADDLPVGYELRSDIVWQNEGDKPYVAVNGFEAARPGHIEVLGGQVLWLPGPAELAWFDRSLADKTWPAEFGFAELGQPEDRVGLEQLGDARAWLAGQLGEEGFFLRGDMVAWRRGNVAAFVAYSYLEDAQEPLAVTDVARRLDERIAWVLSSDPAGGSRPAPTPAPRLMPAARPVRPPIAWSAELTPTLTLDDMPAGFQSTADEMGTTPLVVSEDAPYAAMSTFEFGYSIYTTVSGFVVDLPGIEQQASFDTALSQPDVLFQAVTGLQLTEQGNNPNAPAESPLYADVAGLGDMARQMTITDQGTFFGYMDTDLICWRRDSLGGCVAVESLYPGDAPDARGLAGLLDERMRLFESARP